MSGHYTNFIDAPEKLRMISLLLVAYIKYLVYLKCKRGSAWTVWGHEGLGHLLYCTYSVSLLPMYSTKSRNSSFTPILPERALS